MEIHMKATQEAVSWKEELADLVGSAQNAEESLALAAFEKALSPYLQEPGALRTLLGKIQAMEIVALDSLTAKQEFNSIEELQSFLPANIKAQAA
jgi:hypothetical protein